ncbi:MAG: DUF2520 domain-containing protein [Bacteroidetes bacterium]|nr:DUF2520 domain-containing protein [Bacteroidota bacterium]
MSNGEHSLILIGAGRVGINLLRHCLRIGLPVSLVVERDVSRHTVIRNCDPSLTLSTVIPDSLPGNARYCALTVPDGAVAEVAHRLSLSTGTAGCIIFHCSGTLTSDVLAVPAAAGGIAGGIHPMQSFSSDDLPASMLTGIGCGIEGDEQFCREATKLAMMLQWRPLRIQAEHKALYHAANVFAGNFPTVLASIAERLLRASASDASDASLAHLLPMMRAVMQRIDEVGVAQALTGPAVRGDHETVQHHLDILDTIEPDFHRVYDILSDIAGGMARDRQPEV